MMYHYARRGFYEMVCQLTENGWMRIVLCAYDKSAHVASVKDEHVEWCDRRTFRIAEFVKVASLVDVARISILREWFAQS